MAVPVYTEQGGLCLICSEGSFSLDKPRYSLFQYLDSLDLSALLLQYLDTLDLSPVFSIEEFKHWFIPRKGIVDSYVVEVSYSL